MRRTALATGLFLLLAAAPARADSADFLGIWSDATADGSGISRIAITPGTGNRLAIHVYGKCRPHACDWGGGPVRLYAEGPGGKEITVIAFDIDTGFAHKRLTLRPSVGHALRFEMLTDFTDGRASFATSGAVTWSGEWDAAPRVAEAAAPSPVPMTPGATPAPSAAPEPAPVPSDSAPVPEAPAGSWFGDSGFIHLGPANPRGYAPAAGEDCTPFDPSQTHVANTDGNWRMGDFSHRLVNFGPRRADANRALSFVETYHVDEICYVTRGNPTMIYWKRAGVVPKESLAGEVCFAVDPAAVKPEQKDGEWSVDSGLSALLTYGDDRKGAEQAASVIKTYKLDRQCFAGPPGSGMQYWLAQ